MSYDENVGKMIYSTDYIPGVPEEKIKYCGFLTYELKNLSYGRGFDFPNRVREFSPHASDVMRGKIINQNQEIIDLINEFGGNALIGAKLISNGSRTFDNLILYGTVVKVED